MRQKDCEFKACLGYIIKACFKKKKLRDVVYSVVHCLPSHKGLNYKRKKQMDREKGGRQGEGLRRKGWGNGKLSGKYLSNEI